MRLGARMHSPHSARNHFGVYTTAQLRAVGQSPHRIQKLVKSGALEQLRYGWYALPDAPDEVKTAVRAGGVLTGPSALRLHGVWTPIGVGISARASRTDLMKPGMQRHALRGDLARPTSQSVDDVATSLLVTMRDFPLDVAVVLADSATERKLISWAEFEHIARQAGSRGQAVLRATNPKSESGTETLFRLWLDRNRIRYEVQVHIRQVGRVDFLIGSRLVIEIDSRSHHTAEHSYRNDRRRDRRLVVLGYTVLRLTYEDVMFNLDAVGADVLELIRRDLHRSDPRWRRDEMRLVRDIESGKYAS